MSLSFHLLAHVVNSLHLDGEDGAVGSEESWSRSSTSQRRPRPGTVLPTSRVVAVLPTPVSSTTHPPTSPRPRYLRHRSPGL
jgi:hypothetical protein